MREIFISNPTIKDSPISETIMIEVLGIETDGSKAHWGPGYRAQNIMHFVLSGKGYFNGTPIKAGQGFYIPSNSFQEYYADEKDPWTYMWVIFRGDLSGKLIKLIDLNQNGVFKFSLSEKSEKIRKRVEEIFLLPETVPFFDGLEIFFAMLSLCEPSKSENKNVAIQYVIRAKRFIEENYFHNIKVKDVADYIGVTPNYMAAVFLKAEEISPRKYLSKVRIDKACELLRDVKIPICEIAASVGYSDSLQFSRFFKKEIGYSPSVYRKQKIRTDEE